MTTKQALQHYEDHGIDGLSIEDLDKVYIHWLENSSQYESENQRIHSILFFR